MRHVATMVVGLGVGLALMFGSVHFTSTTERDPASVILIGHRPSLDVAPVLAGMQEGPGVPRFCKQGGAEILAVELGLSQPVSQAACLSFFQSRRQASALNERFCQQAYNAIEGTAGSVISELGGPFTNAGQCLSTLNALGDFR